MDIFKVPKEVKEVIESSNNRFVISSHIAPDGDNIGSISALYHILKRMDKDVVVLLGDKTPDKYEFLLNGIKLIREDSILKDDTWIVVDSSDESRLGDLAKNIESFKTIINIDHHTSNTFFGDYNWVETKAAATGELIFGILEEFNIDLSIPICNAIYTALSTDTGSFKYSNTTENTMRVIYKLHQYGFEHDKIIQSVYQTRALVYLQLLSKTIEYAKYYNKDRIVSILNLNDLKKLNARSEDTDGLVEELRDIEGINISCFIKEIDKDVFKGSLRAKGSYEVIKIAEFFGGGGHKKAAGFTYKGDYNSLLKKLDQIFSGDNKWME